MSFNQIKKINNFFGKLILILWSLIKIEQNDKFNQK